MVIELQTVTSYLYCIRQPFGVKIYVQGLFVLTDLCELTLER